MSSHFREVCRHGLVVRQCRCPGSTVDQVVACLPGCSPTRDEALPGKPGPKLQLAWGGLNDARRAALLPHLLGDTPAEWIALWLDQAGFSVSPSTIRTYRRSLDPSDRSV